MVIEFKKGSDSGVLSQAVSYLSWLDSAHHEFEALVRRLLGPEAAESIDWRRPRMVCIAASFSHHDRVAVQRLPERIDLVRYRVFDGGLLSLLLVDSSPGTQNPAASRRTGSGTPQRPRAGRCRPVRGREVPASSRSACGTCTRNWTTPSRRGARSRWQRFGITSPTGGW
ncbi:hypothetical protein LUR56_04335 [Streptomyces sp. MT29]|nr:hypothetical protein [Streptomyces sp. MT29]